MFLITALSAVMVVLGGIVRLTESGLSIVEWKLVTGIVPPLSEEAWAKEFSKYQQSPEYQKVNYGMSVQEFKFIFYMEYAHRMLGRLLGLAYFLPFLVFWRRGYFDRKELVRLGLIALLMVLQGVFGWFMVKSGLVDVPRVSHYRLTGHLLLALLFLGLTMWTGLAWWNRNKAVVKHEVSATARRTTLALFALLIVQIALGGMVAGMRAGQVSNTFPKMAGVWVPDFIWSIQPWYVNFFENPFMVHFLHRWNAFIVVMLAVVALWLLRREVPTFSIQVALRVFAYLLGVQFFLGVLTIMLHVPIGLASTHQAVAVMLFMTLVYILHSLGTAGQPAPHQASS